MITLRNRLGSRRSARPLAGALARCAVLLAVVATATPLAAQNAAEHTRFRVWLGEESFEIRASGDAQGRDRMALAEDMEVLAAIVREDLQGEFFQSTRPEYCELAAPTSLDQTVGEALAEYVPGHGVVIQVRVPSPRADAEPEPAAAGELSRWELTRRRLQGQSVALDVRSTCSSCHGGPIARSRHATGRWSLWHWMLAGRPKGPGVSDLVERVLKSLAENGDQLRGLEPDERVTVSLSFWERAPENGGQKEEKLLEADGQAASKGERVDEQERSLLAQENDVPEQNPFKVNSYVANPIDPYVVRRLQESGLHSSPYVDYLELIRSLQRQPQKQAGVDDEGQQPQVKLPRRGRIRLSATRQQLQQVADNELTLIAFMRAAQVHVFLP